MRAKKVDRNQPEIVAALRELGCSVAITSAAGEGFPDIVVGRRTLTGDKRNWLIEIKDGELTPSHRKLNKVQEKFHSEWKGQIDVVTDVQSAINLVFNLDSTGE